MHFPALRFWRTVADFDSSRESGYLLPNRRIDETLAESKFQDLRELYVCISQRPSFFLCTRHQSPRYPCPADRVCTSIAHGWELSFLELAVERENGTTARTVFLAIEISS